MRSLILVLLLISLRGYSQSQSPVFVRITPEGQIKIETIPTTMNKWKRDRGDTVLFSVSADPEYKTPPGQMRPRVEYFNRVHMTTFTWQEPLDDFHIYPDTYYGMLQSLTWSDSLIHEDYFVDASFCKVEYWYSVDNYWRFTDGKLTSVTSAVNNSSKDTTVRYYYYHDDGRFDRIVITGDQHYSYNFFCERSTIDFVYDKDKNLTGVVHYTGERLTSVADSTAKWKDLTEVAYDKNSYPEIAGDRDRRACNFIHGVFYSYVNDKLTNALAYDIAYSCILSDTLAYDKSGRLIRFVEAHRSLGYETTSRSFSYSHDKKRVTQKTELVSTLGYDSRYRISYDGVENFEYAPSGYMSAIVHTSKMYKSTSTTYIHYR